MPVVSNRVGVSFNTAAVPLFFYGLLPTNRNLERSLGRLHTLIDQVQHLLVCAVRAGQ